MNTHTLVAKKLIQERKTLAIAESCTGGLIAQRMTSIPGSSKFLKLGIVAYSNEAKTKLLGVSARILKKHGAVSLPAARAMSKGVQKILKTDYGLAITGIAGPGGATSKKPVGLVFITVTTKNKIISLNKVFKGNRREIRKKASESALDLLLKVIAK